MEHPADRFKPLIHCPVCQRKYDPKSVLLLSEDERKTALHLTCGQCGASSIAFVSLGKTGAVSLGMLTDLTGEEAGRFYGKEAVSSDDALSMHRFLKGLRGGVGGHIPKEGRAS